MDAETESKKPIVSYYGKKVYYINALIVRKEPAKEKVPDYRDEAHKIDDPTALVTTLRKKH